MGQDAGGEHSAGREIHYGGSTDEEFEGSDRRPAGQELEGVDRPVGQKVNINPCPRSRDIGGQFSMSQEVKGVDRPVGQQLDAVVDRFLAVLAEEVRQALLLTSGHGRGPAVASFYRVDFVAESVEKICGTCMSCLREIGVDGEDDRRHMHWYLTCMLDCTPANGGVHNRVGPNDLRAKIRENRHRQWAPSFEIDDADIDQGGAIGAGMTFSARWRGRRVAVKWYRVSDLEARAEFLAEAEAHALMCCPNVVACWGFARSGAAHAKVVELADRSLAEFCGTCSSDQGWKLAVKLAAGAACGLRQLHDAGVVHRDVKPRSFLMFEGDDGAGPRELAGFGGRVVKVADFGLALAKAEMHGGCVRSPWYMAPEVYASFEHTFASDVFSFGVVLFELVGNGPPYEGDWNIEELLHRKRSGVVPCRVDAGEIPPELWTLMARCIHPDPDGRPKMSEVEEQLQAVCEHGDSGPSSAANLSVPQASPETDTLIADLEGHCQDIAEMTRNVRGDPLCHVDGVEALSPPPEASPIQREAVANLHVVAAQIPPEVVANLRVVAAANVPVGEATNPLSTGAAADLPAAAAGKLPPTEAVANLPLEVAANLLHAEAAMIRFVAAAANLMSLSSKEAMRLASSLLRGYVSGTTFFRADVDDVISVVDVLRAAEIEMREANNVLQMMRDRQSVLATNLDASRRPAQKLLEAVQRGSPLDGTKCNVLSQIQADAFSVIEGRLAFWRALETDPSAIRIFENRLLRKAAKAAVTNGSMTNRSMTNDPALLIGARVTSLVPGDAAASFRVIVSSLHCFTEGAFLIRICDELRNDELIAPYSPDLTSLSISITENVTPYEAFPAGPPSGAGAGCPDDEGPSCGDARNSTLDRVNGESTLGAASEFSASDQVHENSCEPGGQDLSPEEIEPCREISFELPLIDQREDRRRASSAHSNESFLGPFPRSASQCSAPAPDPPGSTWSPSLRDPHGSTWSPCDSPDPQAPAAVYGGWILACDVPVDSCESPPCALNREELVRAAELTEIARDLKYEGKLHEAREALQEALDILISELGENHMEVAACLHRLAGVFSSLGDFSAAEKSYRRSLVAKLKCLEGHSPSIADSLGGLGVALQKQGKLLEAEECHRRALEHRRMCLSRDDVSFAKTFNNLGKVLYVKGRLADAEFCYVRALRIQIWSYGEGHPRVADSLNNLAAVFERMGKLDEAEEGHLRALKIRRDVLGRNHPEVASSLKSLASVQGRQGRLADAQASLEAAADILEASFGGRHPTVEQTRRALREVRSRRRNPLARIWARVGRGDPKGTGGWSRRPSGRRSSLA
ncbi:unnamed protein product [Ostreobium quekettii]|uniref:Protein kinase domain-containing protein n=1 Tax=Ostreobium quekettii TaxID=121088 RepID=A0A8S1IZ62_9CHLO|nr:unnamed protein product [Ostreobium quekettii]